jgi:hypothetical protein
VSSHCITADDFRKTCANGVFDQSRDPTRATMLSRTLNGTRSSIGEAAVPQRMNDTVLHLIDGGPSIDPTHRPTSSLEAVFLSQDRIFA